MPAERNMTRTSTSTTPATPYSAPTTCNNEKDEIELSSDTTTKVPEKTKKKKASKDKANPSTPRQAAVNPTGKASSKSAIRLSHSWATYKPQIHALDTTSLPKGITVSLTTLLKLKGECYSFNKDEGGRGLEEMATSTMKMETMSSDSLGGKKVHSRPYW
ncbi:hypothetical protein JCM1840_000213 [Sporobolomyces johnsonii]